MLMRIMQLKEILRFYRDRSRPTVRFLDATKAFDCVDDVYTYSVTGQVSCLAVLVLANWNGILQGILSPFVWDLHTCR